MLSEGWDKRRYIQRRLPTGEGPGLLRVAQLEKSNSESPGPSPRPLGAGQDPQVCMKGEGNRSPQSSIRAKRSPGRALDQAARGKR